MIENTGISRLNPGDVEDPSGTIDSMPELGNGELDSEHGVVLKNWSAQDFASIYVRFRPHLISHARKFLRAESQAEEVVQDAFLYLMTALPELDSELGVLRFLKWKTKMLCMDVLRYSTSGLNGSLVPLPDNLAEEAEPSDALERADDAAIIRLALAKLHPRHREVLISTLYEEKTQEEVARQMGLEKNALRQLLFRARTSFKLALVGEANVEGKTISEILAVASRRAAAGSKQALSIAVVLAIGGSLIFGSDFQPRAPENFASVSAVEERESFRRPPARQSTNDSSIETNAASQAPNSTSPNDAMSDAEDVTSDYVFSEAITRPPRMAADLAADFTRESRGEMEAFLNAGLASMVFDSSSATLSVLDSHLMRLETSSGIAATTALNFENQPSIEQVHFSISIEGYTFYMVPMVTLSAIDKTEAGTRLSFAASDFIVGDFGGQFDNLTTDLSELSKLKVVVSFLLDQNGVPEYPEIVVISNP